MNPAIRISTSVTTLLGLLSFFACDETPKKVESKATAPVELMQNHQKYPKELNAVFKAHGTMIEWRKMKNLTFEISKPEGNEIHSVNLLNRKDKVEASNFSLGFDGENVWLKDDKNTYKGNAKYYHNLMFYFYTMPFVLGDNGIKYDKTEAIEFEGKTYPGIKISFLDGTGLSATDEYYLHYNPQNHQMAWLGYTATFESGQKSDKVNWIRYSDWTKVSGILLPKTISWFEHDNGKLMKPRNTVNFENIVLSKQEKNAFFYDRPADAKIIE